MSNNFKLPPFPVLEMKLIKKQSKKFNNWHILQMEEEDFQQEVIAKIISEMDKWDCVREVANSEMILKKYINNYCNKIYTNILRDKLNYSHDDLDFIIKQQIMNADGKCNDYYESLPDNEKQYFLNVYCFSSDKPKTYFAKNSKISVSRKTTIELRMKQCARVEKYREDNLLYNDIGDFHE